MSRNAPEKTGLFTAMGSVFYPFSPDLFDIGSVRRYNGHVYLINAERSICPWPRIRGQIVKRMDFLKKNPYPLAAYCFAGCSVLQIFFAGNIISTLTLLSYLFLTAILFMKRRDILLVAAAAVPSVINLLSIIIYGTSFLGFLSFLAGLLVPGYVACFLLPQLEPYVGKYTEQLKKYWFVPAAARALFWFLIMFSTFISVVQWGALESFFLSYNFFNLLLTALSIGGNLLLCNWMVYPDGLPAEWFDSKPSEPVYNPNTGTYEQPAAGSDLELSMMTHILLLLFLGGIWLCIWVYRTTRALNNIPGEEDRNPVTKLLLCIFIPFYYIYWVYKSAQRIDKLAAMKGIPSDIGSLCLILAILIGIVPPIIMQDKMNSIAATGNARRDDPYAGPADYRTASQPVSAAGSDIKFKDKDSRPAAPIQMPAPPERPQLAEPSQPQTAVSAPSYAEDTNTDDSASMKKFM